MAARKDRQPDHMRLLLAHGIDDLLGRQPDALIDHLHAGVAGAHRDLLGAVGMAVEAGLADQERHSPPELARNAIDVGANVVEAADVVAHRLADAGRRAVFAEGFAQGPAPFAGGDAGFGAGDRRRHDVGAAGRGALEVSQRRRDRAGVARRAPGLQPLDLIDLGLLGDRHDRFDAAGQRRGLAFEIFVDADHDLVAALDRLEPRRVGIDQRPLHVAGFDRGDRAAHLLDALQFVLGFALELVDLARHHRRAVEQVAVFQQIGLVGEDLLHPQRPLLVPRPRQAERLVPGRKLHGAGAGVLRQRHRQHLDHDARDVVLRLRLGEARAN